MRLIARGQPQDTTFEAHSDLSGANGSAPNGFQFTFVKLVATSGGTTTPQARVDPQTSAPTGTGGDAFILQNRPKQYKGAVVRGDGYYSKLVVLGGTAIAAGDRLKPSTAGCGTKISAGDEYSAIACEPSTVDYEIIEVYVKGGLSHT
jgi:hypothetical protein